MNKNEVKNCINCGKKSDCDYKPKGVFECWIPVDQKSVIEPALIGIDPALPDGEYTYKIYGHKEGNIFIIDELEYLGEK